MNQRSVLAFFLVLFMGGLLPASQEGQEQVWPEFYGFYVQANGQLIPLPKILISYAFAPEIGLDRDCITGIAYIPPNDFKLDRLKLLLFQQGAEKNVPGIKLSKLTYQKRSSLKYSKKKPGTLDQEYITDVFMWVAESEIPLQKGPVSGRPEMYQLVPGAKLEPGVYAVHWGHLWQRAISRPGTPFGKESPGAYIFSIHIDQVADAADQPKKTAKEIESYVPMVYGQMLPTQENLTKLLSLVHDYLKTRKRPQKSSDILDDTFAEFYRDVTENLTNAWIALNGALSISDLLAQDVTSALIKDWDQILQNALNLVWEKQSGWKTKSYDMERKVRLGVSKLLKVEDKE